MQTTTSAHPLMVTCQCGHEFPSALRAWERVYATTGESWPEIACPGCGTTYQGRLTFEAVKG